MNAELTQEGEKAINEILPVAEKVVGAWRFGEHYGMIFLIPVILLFSYTRSHENQKADIFIPIGGVALAFLVGIEGLYQGLVMNLPILIGQNYGTGITVFRMRAGAFCFFMQDVFFCLYFERAKWLF